MLVSVPPSPSPHMSIPCHVCTTYYLRTIIASFVIAHLREPLRMKCSEFSSWKTSKKRGQAKRRKKRRGQLAPKHEATTPYVCIISTKISENGHQLTANCVPGCPYVQPHSNADVCICRTRFMSFLQMKNCLITTPTTEDVLRLFFLFFFYFLISFCIQPSSRQV